MTPLIPNQRVRAVSVEALAAVQERELDDENAAGNYGVALGYEVCTRSQGAARCEQIIDENHSLARLDCVDVHLYRIRSVLERVLDPVGRVRKLSGLTDRNKPYPESVRESRAENKPPGLRTREDVGLQAVLLTDRCDAVYDLREDLSVLKKRSDVLEADSLLGEIWNLANVGPVNLNSVICFSHRR